MTTQQERNREYLEGILLPQLEALRLKKAEIEEQIAVAEASLERITKTHGLILTLDDEQFGLMRDLLDDSIINNSNEQD